MRVHAVSDVHGRADALGKAGAGADALICLGDLLLFIDYADHSQGIFPDLFGADRARRLVELRSAGRFDEARAMSGELWAQLGGDPHQHIEAAVSRQYAALFAAMPVPSYLTYGNVDLPKLWAEYARPGQTILDGERVELDGWTFGFVGGGLRTTYRTPNEIDDDEFAAKVEAIGEVDVLDLLYDTVARRMERGSEALLAAIEKTQPRYVLFGHVHQPLQSRVRIGRTECINVGHFRATGMPYVLQWG
jgi:Icc-related predicted phosphoesterase